jgi:hypothetical protein
MQFESARAFFEAIAARGHEPRLADAIGSWEFHLEGGPTWTVTVDHGTLHVVEGQRSQPAARKATRLRLREDELLRLVRGDGHENLFMALLRGALVIEGELAFAQRLQAILPVTQDEPRAQS